MSVPSERLNRLSCDFCHVIDTEVGEGLVRRFAVKEAYSPLVALVWLVGDRDDIGDFATSMVAHYEQRLRPCLLDVSDGALVDVQDSRSRRTYFGLDIDSLPIPGE